MARMKIHVTILCLLLALCPAQGVPPAEKLLPEDTLMFVTAPDFVAFREALTRTPRWQLLNDPAASAFREKFLNRFEEEFAKPLQRDWGIDVAGLYHLAEGQVTLAMTESGNAKGKDSLELIVLVDVGERRDLLKEKLRELRQTWIESGKEFRVQTLRDIEFLVLATSEEEIARTLGKIFPNPAAALPGSPAPNQKPSGEKVDLFMGQSGSLLVVANSSRNAERIVDRQSGVTAPSVSDVPGFEADQKRVFRQSHLYAWVNGKRLVDRVAANMAEAAKAAGDNPFMPRPDRIFAASGLQGMRSMALSYRQRDEGSMLELFVAIPEPARKGLFNLLALERKETGMPGFIPADAVKFSRSRVNLEKSWKGFETMLREIMPAFSGAIELIFEAAGKDRDPNYDLRRELVGNLGEDIITYQKLPPDLTVDSLESPPSIFLVGSPDPERLGAAVRVLLSLLMPQPGGIKEREFLGRKIYTLQVTSLFSPETGSGPRRTVQLSASGGYLAVSTDAAMIEQYLRSGGETHRSLKETAGLDEAAQAVEGTGLGMFGFNNRREEMRARLELAQKNPGVSANLFSIPILSSLGMSLENTPAADWADASLLPPFNVISKYFHYSVHAGSLDAAGLTVKFFSPTPPELRK
jgi:hypothetical protein